MKLAITKSKDFPFGVRAVEISGGWRVTWFNHKMQKETTISITDRFVRERCDVREMVDASNIYIEMDKEGHVVNVHNKLATTVITKSSGGHYQRKTGRTIAAQIYIPFSSDRPSDWILRLNGNEEKGIDLPFVNFTVDANEHAIRKFGFSVLPSLVVIENTRVDKEISEVKVQLMLNSKPCWRLGVRVFANADAGYINKRELITNQHGVGTIKARRLDLDPMDKMVVEFGFKFLRNLTSTEIK